MRVDGALLGDLQMVTAGFERLRHRVPAAALLGPVQAHVTMLRKLLSGSLLPAERAALLTGFSQAASLMSWLRFFDRGDRAVGRSWLAASVQAAEESDDAALRVLGLIRAAEQRTYDGRGSDSVQLLEHAERLARRKASANALSWVYAAKAEAYATLGQETPCQRLLDQAERARQRGGDEPSWCEYWNRSRVASYAGASFMRLRRPARARAALIEGLDGASVKHRSINLVDLAITYAQENDIEPAVEFAEQALDIAGPLHYGTTIERMRTLRELLGSSDARCVKDFNERLAALRGAGPPKP